MVMRKSFSDFLIDAGLVTQQHVTDCQQEIKDTGVRLESCLVNNKRISPENLARAYASYLNIPYIEKITDQMAEKPAPRRVC